MTVRRRSLATSPPTCVSCATAPTGLAIATANPPACEAGHALPSSSLHLAAGVRTGSPACVAMTPAAESTSLCRFDVQFRQSIRNLGELVNRRGRSFIRRRSQWLAGFSLHRLNLFQRDRFYAFRMRVQARRKGGESRCELSERRMRCRRRQNRRPWSRGPIHIHSIQLASFLKIHRRVFGAEVAGLAPAPEPPPNIHTFRFLPYFASTLALFAGPTAVSRAFVSRPVAPLSTTSAVSPSASFASNASWWDKQV